MTARVRPLWPQKLPIHRIRPASSASRNVVLKVLRTVFDAPFATLNRD